MDKKVDLVMTAYNSAGFIERSLDSVLRQTVRPHVIVVDDASTDGTAELVESYAKRTGLDVELLILPENLGAGLAKRVGIQRSKADFITFLDSDDLLPKRSIEWFLERQAEGDYDIVAGGVVKSKNGKIEIFPPKPAKSMTGKEATIPFIEMQLCNIFANSKLIRRSLLDKCPPYSELRYGEDTDSTYHWFWNADKVYVDTSFPAYLYVIREGSITNTSFNLQKFECVVRTLENMAYFCKSNNISLSKMLSAWLTLSDSRIDGFKNRYGYIFIRDLGNKIRVKYD